jgi:DNA polymerase III epsilon subunit-like protein
LNEVRFLGFSKSRLYALNELCKFIEVAQGNLNYLTIKKHSDLLNTAHPYSAAPHAMTAAARNHAQLQWYMADPIVTEETAPLIASAFSPETDELTRTYALTRLTASAEGLRALEALTAAFSGDGNSYFARRMRAMRQRRDRLGRFAEEGGGMRSLLRLADGSVHWLTGRSVGADPNSNTFDVETARGIVRVPAGSAEGIKAYLPGGEDANGVSPAPAKISSADESDIINEADLQIVDSPAGWEAVENFKGSEGEKAFTDGTYTVAQTTGEDGKNAYRLIDEDGTEISQGDSWAKMLDDSMTDALGGKDRPELPEDMLLSGLDEIANNDTAAGLSDAARNIAEYLRTGNAPENLSPSELAKNALDIAEAIKKNTFGEKFQGFEDDFRNGADAINKKLKGAQAEDKRAQEKQKPVAKLPKEDTSIPKGAYEVETGEYFPEGYDGQDSEEYTDDPEQLARKFSLEKLQEALKKSVLGEDPTAVDGSGDAPLEFSEGTEYVPAEAVYNAIKRKGGLPDAMIANFYKEGNERLAGVARLDENDGDAPEIEDVDVPEGDEDISLLEDGEEPDVNEDDLADAFVKAKAGKKPKDAKKKEVTPLKDDQTDEDHDKSDDLEEGSDEPVPALIDSLSEDEKYAFAESGFDHTPYLPANEEIELPEGYHVLDPEPFALDNITTVEEGDELNQLGIPVGWTDDPYFLANNHSTEELIEQLTFALEPRDEDSDYETGMAPFDVTTENDEEIPMNIPAEAIRDALQLQGEDTNEIIQRIADEAFAALSDEGEVAPDVEDGQSSGDLSDEEMRLMMEGEGVSPEKTGTEPFPLAKTIMERTISEYGLTIKPITGDEPTSGYVVAIRGFNLEIPKDVWESPEGRKLFKQYVKDHKDKFVDNQYLGTWFDEANNEVCLDVVEVISDRDEAVKAGFDRNQQEIYDVVKKETIPTGGTGDRAAEETGNIPSETSKSPGDDGRSDRRVGGQPVRQDIGITDSKEAESVGGVFKTDGLSDAAKSRLDKHLKSKTRFQGEVMTNEEFYNRFATGKKVYQAMSFPEDGPEGGVVGKTRYAVLTGKDKFGDKFIDVPKYVYDAFDPASGRLVDNTYDENGVRRDIDSAQTPTQPSAVDESVLPENPEEPTAPVTDEQTPTKWIKPTTRSIKVGSDELEEGDLIDPTDYVFPEEIPEGSSDWRIWSVDYVDSSDEDGQATGLDVTIIGKDADGEEITLDGGFRTDGNSEYTVYENDAAYIAQEEADSKARHEAYVKWYHDTYYPDSKTNPTPTADSYISEENLLPDTTYLDLDENEVPAPSFDELVNETVQRLPDGRLYYPNLGIYTKEPVEVGEAPSEYYAKFAEDNAPEGYDGWYGDNFPDIEDAQAAEDNAISVAKTPRSLSIGKRPARTLQPGDVTVGDNFTIVEVGTDIDDENKIVIKGYFPGHPVQEKMWRHFAPINVVRGLDEEKLPKAGDLPEVHQPKREDFEGGENNNDYKLEYAKWRGQINAARARWTDAPAGASLAFNPDTDPHMIGSHAEFMRPGDILADRGHFVVTRVFTDEKTKDGNVSVEGYYPGHMTQRKEWRKRQARGPMDVIRNAELPASGPLAEFHQPHFYDAEGNWKPDYKDVEGQKLYKKLLGEAAARYDMPKNLPILELDKNTAGDPSVAQDDSGVVPEMPKYPPFVPNDPFGQGEAAELLRAADGDWGKFAESLKGKELIFFDYETTGLMRDDTNNPVQIGAVRVVDGEIVDRFNVFMNPERNLEGWSLDNLKDADGNPLTDEYLQQQISMKDAHDQFTQWAGENGILIAHNSAFDREVLERVTAREGISYNPAGYMDALAMARAIHKEDPNKPENNKLPTLAEHYGVDLGEGWHTADADSQATAGVFQALLNNAVENGYGKSLFDVDKNIADNERAMGYYNDVLLPEYKNKVAAALAYQAVQDAMNGKDVNVDDLVKAASNTSGMNNPADVNNPSGGKPFDVTVAPNSVFPDGRMRLANMDWVMDDANARDTEFKEVQVKDLLPGDFMYNKSGDKIFQVISVTDQNREDRKATIRRVDIETGIAHDFHQHYGVRLDKIRRPINRGSLAGGDNGDSNLSDVIKIDDATVSNAPILIEHKDIPGSTFTATTSIKPDENGNIVGESIVVDKDGIIVGSQTNTGASIEEVTAKSREFHKSTSDELKKLIEEAKEAFGIDQTPKEESIPDELKNNLPPVVKEEDVFTDANGDRHYISLVEYIDPENGSKYYESVIAGEFPDGSGWDLDDAKYDLSNDMDELVQGIKKFKKENGPKSSPKPSKKPVKSKEKKTRESRRIPEDAFLREEVKDDGSVYRFWETPSGDTYPFDAEDPKQIKSANPGQVYGNPDKKIISTDAELNDAMSMIYIDPAELDSINLDNGDFKIFEAGQKINGAYVVGGGKIDSQVLDHPDGHQLEVELDRAPNYEGEPDIYRVIIRRHDGGDKIEVLADHFADIDVARNRYVELMNMVQSGQIQVNPGGPGGPNGPSGDADQGDRDERVAVAGGKLEYVRVVGGGNKKFQTWSNENFMYASAKHQARLGDRVEVFWGDLKGLGDGTIIDWEIIHNRNDKSRIGYALVAFGDNRFAIISTDMLILKGRGTGFEGRADYKPPVAAPMPELSDERVRQYALRNRYVLERKMRDRSGKKQFDENGDAIVFNELVPYVANAPVRRTFAEDVILTAKALKMQRERGNRIRIYHEANGLNPDLPFEIRPPGGDNRDARIFQAAVDLLDGKPFKDETTDEKAAKAAKAPKAAKAAKAPAASNGGYPESGGAFTESEVKNFIEDIKSALSAKGISGDVSIESFEYADENPSFHTQGVLKVDIGNENSVTVNQDEDGFDIIDNQLGIVTRGTAKASYAINEISRLADKYKNGGNGGNGGNDGTPPPYPSEGGAFTDSQMLNFVDDVTSALSAKGIEAKVNYKHFISIDDNPENAGAHVTVSVDGDELIRLGIDSNRFMIYDTKLNQFIEIETAQETISRIAKIIDTSKKDASNIKELVEYFYELDAEKDYSNEYLFTVSDTPGNSFFDILDKNNKNRASIKWDAEGDGWGVEISNSFYNLPSTKKEVFADLNEAGEHALQFLDKFREENPDFTSQDADFDGYPAGANLLDISKVFDAFAAMKDNNYAWQLENIVESLGKGIKNGKKIQDFALDESDQQFAGLKRYFKTIIDNPLGSFKEETIENAKSAYSFLERLESISTLEKERLHKEDSKNLKKFVADNPIDSQIVTDVEGPFTKKDISDILISVKDRLPRAVYDDNVPVDAPYIYNAMGELLESIKRSADDRTVPLSEIYKLASALSQVTHRDASDGIDENGNGFSYVNHYKNMSNIVEELGTALLTQFAIDDDISFGAVNAEKINFEELRQERLKARENVVKLPATIKELFSPLVIANDSNLYLYADELNDFFANVDGDGSPLSMLDYRARRALNNTVSGLLVSDELYDLEKVDLVSLYTALNEERLAYEPNRTSLGVGEFLKNIDPQEIIKIREKEVNFRGDTIPLVIDGEDTGWDIQSLTAEGVNFTVKAIHRSSGQEFIFKKEAGSNTANAEIVGSILGRSMDMLGASYVERSNVSDDVIIMTYAGDSILQEGVSGGAAIISGDERRVKTSPLSRMKQMIIDAVLENVDRHNGNYNLSKDNSLGSLPSGTSEDYHILPIDHGHCQFFWYDSDRYDNAETPFEFLLNGGGSAGGLYGSTMQDLGDDVTKAIVDVSIQQLLQRIKREASSPGKEIPDSQIQGIINRLVEMQAMTSLHWDEVRYALRHKDYR